MPPGWPRRREPARHRRLSPISPHPLVSCAYTQPPVQPRAPTNNASSMPSPQRYRTFVISENMALRSGTRSPLAHESEDPFYAPTNLATRLRANPQPQRPQHPPAGPSYPNDGSSALFGELMQMTPSSHKFEGSTPRPPPPPPLPPANRGGGGPVARGSPDSLGRTLFALVLVLFLLWRGAASSLAELTAQNARLMEERGQFVMSLMDWNQRLLDTE